MILISRFIRNNWIWLLLIILMAITTKKYMDDADRAFTRSVDLTDSIRYYKLKNGSVVASKEVLEYNDVQLRALLNNSNENIKELSKKFSKIELQIQLISKIKVDSLSVKYDKPIPLEFERSGSIIEPHYSFEYKSVSDGFKIANFELTNDTVTFIKGTKRKWLFGKETNTLDIIHSNPYISDIKLDAMQLKEDKKWYQTTGFKIGVGLLGGILISEQMNK